MPWVACWVANQSHSFSVGNDQWRECLPGRYKYEISKKGKTIGRNNTHSKQMARRPWEDSTWKIWSGHPSVKRGSNNKEAIYAQMSGKHITHFIEEFHKRYRMRGRTSAVDKKAVWLAESRFCLKTKSLNFLRTKINKNKLTILSQQAGICIRALNLDFCLKEQAVSELQGRPQYFPRRTSQSELGKPSVAVLD